MKKRLLFVIDSLNCAGAEKSLVTLLSFLDYSQYKVDLMLFGHGGELEEVLPNEVRILEPLEYSRFARLNILSALLYSIKNFNFKKLKSRLRYTIKIRKANYGNVEKARIYWECVSHVIEENSIDYDIAISYAQGIPSFYVANKVRAKKKLAWVNTIYTLNSVEKQFQKDYYNHFSTIVTVSDIAQEKFIETFPEFSNKVMVMYDIINPDLIRKMADITKKPYSQYPGLKILTIGRFDSSKGYDIALETCRKLKERGYKFKWYVLGKGPLENDIKQYIQKHKLGEHFILLGVKSNPYPYIKSADIYVQTSRFEGFGLAIAEARILNTPVVTTRFDAVNNQMINEKNGLVVEMNADSVCNGITRLIENQDLRNNIIDYLKRENKGNVEEIEKFNKLIR